MYHALALHLRVARFKKIKKAKFGHYQFEKAKSLKLKKVKKAKFSSEICKNT